MKHLITTCLLTLLLAGPGPARPSAVLTPEDIAVMMRAMLVMTKIWNATQGADGGDFGYGYHDGGWPQAFSYATPWGGNTASVPGMAMWPYMASMMGLGSAAMSSYLPGTSSWSNPNAWFSSPTHFLNPWASLSSWPGTTGIPGVPSSPMGLLQPRGTTSTMPRPADGTWLAANGNLMSIRGERFVFEDSESVSGYGRIEMRQGRIVLHDQLSGSSGAYRIRLRYDQFTLSDDYGRTQVFHRIVQRNTPVVRDLRTQGTRGSPYGPAQPDLGSDRNPMYRDTSLARPADLLTRVEDPLQPLR